MFDQYYKFYNKTKKADSTISFPSNKNLTWISTMYGLEYEEINEIFRYVIKENKWSENDKVCAYSSYLPDIQWEDYHEKN